MQVNAEGTGKIKGGSEKCRQRARTWVLDDLHLADVRAKEDRGDNAENWKDQRDVRCDGK